MGADQSGVEETTVKSFRGSDEAKEGVLEDNEDGISCLQEIELARLKSERLDEGKMKVEGLK